MKNFILLVLLGISLMACKRQSKEVVATSQIDYSQGQKAMEKHCSLCHRSQVAEADKIAPTMSEVKSAYLKDGVTAAQFEASIKKWLHKSDSLHSKMPEAVARYGIMPKGTYPDEDIKAIAQYVYHNDLNQQKKNNKEKTKAEIGMEIALNTKKVLGKNLMGKMQKEGALEALQFCNVKALSLTDSMSVVQNAKIKRVSDKNRNPSNVANKEEMEFIKHFKDQLVKEEKIVPKTIDKEGYTQFYAPIITNSMCLKCHGTPSKQILPEVYKEIKQLYPEDKATGYQANQVRGIWSIQFYKN